MNHFYMIRRKSDGLYHVSNFRQPATLGHPYVSIGSCKNGYNALKKATMCSPSDKWEIVEFSMQEVRVIPIPATPPTQPNRP